MLEALLSTAQQQLRTLAAEKDALANTVKSDLRRLHDLGQELQEGVNGQVRSRYAAHEARIQGV